MDQADGRLHLQSRILPGKDMERRTHHLALPEESTSHPPGLHEVPNAPHVRNILLCGKIRINVPVLLFQVRHKIHEKVVDDVRLIAFSYGVKINS